MRENPSQTIRNQSPSYDRGYRNPRLALAPRRAHRRHGGAEPDAGASIPLVSPPHPTNHIGRTCPAFQKVNLNQTIKYFSHLTMAGTVPTPCLPSLRRAARPRIGPRGAGDGKPRAR